MRRVLEEAIDLRENSSTIWGNLADAYRYTTGMGDKAVTAYRRAIALAAEQLAVNPRDAQLRSSMAVHYAKAGDIDKAMEIVGAAVQQNPDDYTILFNTVIIYEIAGRRDDALRALERVVQGGSHLEELKKDPELEELRATDEYRRLVSP